MHKKLISKTLLNPLMTYKHFYSILCDSCSCVGHSFIKDICIYPYIVASFKESLAYTVRKQSSIF